MFIIWRFVIWNFFRLNWEENIGFYFEYILEGIKWFDFNNKKKKNRIGYVMINLFFGKIKVINNNFIYNRSFFKVDIFLLVLVYFICKIFWMYFML